MVEFCNITTLLCGNNNDIYGTMWPKLGSGICLMDVYHLLKIADWMDDVADHAENVADWLRVIIAR